MIHGRLIKPFESFKAESKGCLRETNPKWDFFSRLANVTNFEQTMQKAAYKDLGSLNVII
jgi:hypothetical protein